ncbi:MAG: hypothetical protein HOK63_07165 [Thaumarchaeota archaeon]|jgi:hypothetical protein|nr:hypothetical protein [Nitrososphaerota archaeon]MBT5842864.1 hypothetical protein [Nitrososphaerota archaeon]MBT6469407.1 hypothetical protein [Nitrososphaerota archaeon]
MLVKCDVDSTTHDTISNSVTLVPRLEYSVNLLNEIIEVLDLKKYDLKQSNRDLVTDFDEHDESHYDSIRLEHTINFSLETLFQIKNKTKTISGVHSIPTVLSSSIPVIRTVSAQLFNILPNCSQKLSELSVHLGSIVLDSAVLTKARFDFSQSNNDSTTLLDEVKLMVDSKISKQYPNLDFFKLCNT